MERVELGPADARDLVELYDEYDWWADRTVEDVRTALANTTIALGVREGGALVAAARVVTDGVYYGKCYDVVVAANRRGEGVGRALVAAVADHPALDDVFLSLTCREGLVDFYERCGFEPYPGPVDRPDGAAEEMRHLYRPRDGDGAFG